MFEAPNLSCPRSRQRNVLITNFLVQTLQPAAVFSNSTLLDSGPANGSHGVPENNSVALRILKVEAWWRVEAVRLFVSALVLMSIRARQPGPNERPSHLV